MKNKSSQILISMILIVLAIALGIYLIMQRENLIWYWVLGVSFGYVMQRSSICFVAAASEPVLIGSTSQFRAILTAILVSSVGITAVKFLSFGNLNFLSVSAISIPLVTGAFLFGIGMILSGCCLSGMFIRLAEGYIVHIVTFVCVIIGYLLADSHYESVWKPFILSSPVIFLPEKFGWLWGVLIHIVIILLLYTTTVKWEKKKLAEGEDMR